jgi:hypothetical protein
VCIQFITRTPQTLDIVQNICEQLQCNESTTVADLQRTHYKHIIWNFECSIWPMRGFEYHCIRTVGLSSRHIKENIEEVPRFPFSIDYWSRDSSVGIGTGYRQDGPGSIPSSARFFSSSRIQISSGAHPASYPMDTGGFSPGNKAEGE